MSDDTCVIKSYVEIALEAERRRLGPLYRVWILARHVSPGSCGRVSIKDLRRFVSSHRLFGLRVLERAIAKPCIFYHKFRGYLEFHAVLKVADALDVELRDRPTWIPLQDFTSIGRLRAALMASYFAHKPRTRAIATLMELTGRSRSSVCRYLRSEHIVKTPNVMVSRRDPTLDLTPEMAQEGYFHGRVAGKTVLLKRMPNTYETDLEPAAYGQVKQQRLSSSSTPTESFDRRYFSNPKGAARALQALQPYHSLYLLSGNCFDDMGSQLWRGYWCLDPHGPNHEL